MPMSKVTKRFTLTRKEMIELLNRHYEIVIPIHTAIDIEDKEFQFTWNEESSNVHTRAQTAPRDNQFKNGG